MEEKDEQGAVPEQQGGVEGEARPARGRRRGGVGGGGAPGSRRRRRRGWQRRVWGRSHAGLEEEAASRTAATGSGEEGGVEVIESGEEGGVEKLNRLR